ncbi:MAG: isochorismatase family cysteine hydrolase [Candidatus Parvarchaeota archaeon]
MQRDFVSDDGFLRSRSHNMKPVQHIVNKINRLIDFCWSIGIMIIFTQTIHYTYTNSAIWEGRSAEKIRTPGICKPGTSGVDIIDELSPLDGESIVVKHRYDAFFGTDLDLILRSNNIFNLLVAGTQTNVCVDSTARHGFILDYYTTLIEDCISTPDTEFHEPTIRNFEANFGYVLLSSKIMENCLK